MNRYLRTAKELSYDDFVAQFQPAPDGLYSWSIVRHKGHDWLVPLRGFTGETNIRTKFKANENVKIKVQ